MKFSELILAIILIYFGVELINYHEKLKKRKESSSFSFSIQISGMSLIILGIIMIVKLFLYLVAYVK